MLYKIDYTTRNERTQGSKFVNFAADRTEAVTRFMDWFFVTHPADAVRLEAATAIELTGDLSLAHLVDDAISAQD